MKQKHRKANKLFGMSFKKYQIAVTYADDA